MAKMEILSNFHDPKFPPPPSGAASKQVANEGKKEGSQEEAPKSESNGKAVEKKPD
jgi:hypothetical protein